MHPKEINIADYNYILPEENIAKFPAKVRDQSKLLIVDGEYIKEDEFFSLPNHLPQNSLLVFNNTRVIHARLHFKKNTGALIELFCLEPFKHTDYSIAFAQKNNVIWNCMVGNLKKWKGQILSLPFKHNEIKYTLNAEYIEEGEKAHTIRFFWDGDLCFSEILEACGELPIPPYLHRDTEESDLENYQTIYSKIKGSVAAPTAGLHFTPQVLDNCLNNGINIEEITLHVGAGTFQPVKTEQIAEHKMHTEIIQVNLDTIENLASHKGKIISVGTTSVRTLESLYWMGTKIINNSNTSYTNLAISQWHPYSVESLPSKYDALMALANFLKQENRTTLFSSTEIIIVPGYKFQVVEGIITNFHQPKSTLLLLISAFLQIPFTKVYKYALDHNFRFLSYGDSSLLLSSN